MLVIACLQAEKSASMAHSASAAAGLTVYTAVDIDMAAVTGSSRNPDFKPFEAQNDLFLAKIRSI